MQVIDRPAFKQDLANASGKPTSRPTQISTNRASAWSECSMLGRSNQPNDEFVGKLDGFAVLVPGEVGVTRSASSSL
jgi:hypothetical protein